MIRSDREITDRQEMLDIMGRCDVCRLALNGSDGYPYLLPLNFGMEEADGTLYLYFHGAAEGTSRATNTVTTTGKTIFSRLLTSRRGRMTIWRSALVIKLKWWRIVAAYCRSMQRNLPSWIF